MAPLPDLETLIQAVRADASSDDPLEQLAQAARSVSELEELADAVLGHFVEGCRAAGLTWTQISSALGVSKQAVHKRFAGTGLPSGPPTFERFTPRARAVLKGASDAARAAGHGYVGTEHLLLGLLDPPEAIAAQILAEQGIHREAITAQLPDVTGERTATDPDTPVPFSPRARTTLRQAVDEALGLGHNYIGTEHLLLALYAQPDSRAATVLAVLGATEDDTRRRVINKLARFTKSS
ncbi:MAG TPA: Clp protease N-terminal domain-containing protein [Acidimicrobiales bacterium]|nr:Clp protease N-terminal domain-containing protein [Acidimicrobiales bacterium]